MTFNRAVKQNPVDRSVPARRKPGTPAIFAGRPHDRALCWFLLAALIYSIIYYAWPLPSLAQASGRAWHRYQFFTYLLVPEVLTQAWFGDPPQMRIADRLPIVGAAAAIALSGWAAGVVALRAARVDRGLCRLERLLFAIGIGLNVVSLYTLAVGLAGLLARRWLFFAPGTLTVVAAIVLTLRDRHAFAPPCSEQTVRPGRFWHSPWFWIALPFALFIVLGGMLPPVDFDVREYHLEAPKEFYLAGRISFLPHNVYGNMPLASEMHALLGMVVLGDWWRGALVGKTIQAAFTLFAALALIAGGRRWYSPAGGMLAALVYLSAPWIVHVSTQGLVESALAFYVLLTIYAVWLGSGASEDLPLASHRLMLAGFMAGSAVAVKYPAMLFVLAPLAIFVFAHALAWRARADSLQHALRPVAVFLVAALAACGPWFAKNWALTGNPTYPLLYRLFDGQTRTADKNEQWERAHRPPNFDLSDLAARAGSVLLSSEWQSPVVWPLTALALLGARDRRGRWLLAYFGFVFAAWWLFTHRIDRFWLPALPVICMASGASAMWSSSRPRRIAVAITVGVGVIYGAILLAGGVLGYNRFFVSLDRLRVDPQRVGEARLWLNRHVPHNETVLVVGDAEVFDLEMPVLYNTVFDDSVFEQRVRGPDGRLLPIEEIRRRMRGISYVYVNWREISRYRSPGNYGFSAFIQPEVFVELVRGGVLERPIELEMGQCQVYRVVSMVGSTRQLAWREPN